MPTIKRKVEMNLPHLIEWGFENDVTNTWYRASNVEEYISEVFFDATGLPQFSNTVNKNDTFTVEVEEVVTEDTELYLVERYISSYEDFKLKYKSHQNRSIKSILENRSPHLKTTHFYTEVNNELVLIWKNGKMVE